MAGCSVHIKPIIHVALGKVLKRAGLERVRFHDLRHTSATFRVTIGTDLATVKEILGHASIDMTMRDTHPTSVGKMGAVNAVENQMVGTDKHHSSTDTKITTLQKAVNSSNKQT